MDKLNNTHKIYQRNGKLHFQDHVSYIRTLFNNNQCLAFKNFSIDNGKTWQSMNKDK